MTDIKYIFLNLKFCKILFVSCDLSLSAMLTELADTLAYASLVTEHILFWFLFLVYFPYFD